MTDISTSISLTHFQATGRLAERLAHLCQPGEAILLRGDLGVGKTTFARYFIRALAGPDTEVPSPTFTLVQTYPTAAFTLWHFDLYRLQSAEEGLELGIEEAFTDGVSLIEWPEIIEYGLPKHLLSIDLEFGDTETQRIARLTGAGNWKHKLQTLRTTSP